MFFKQFETLSLHAGGQNTIGLIKHRRNHIRLIFLRLIKKNVLAFLEQAQGIRHSGLADKTKTGFKEEGLIFVQKAYYIIRIN